MLVARIAFACLSVERCGTAAWIEEINCAVAAGEAKALNQAWCRDIEACERVVYGMVGLPGKLDGRQLKPDTRNTASGGEIELKDRSVFVARRLALHRSDLDGQ